MQDQQTARLDRTVSRLEEHWRKPADPLESMVLMAESLRIMDGICRSPARPSDMELRFLALFVRFSVV